MSQRKLSEFLDELVPTVMGFLTFKSVKPDLENFGNHYLGFGILSAWIAGVGRYWDHPNADLWQYLGLGSVAYIFILALILWLLILPLRPQNWSFKSVLIFVGMTSPLAFVYAIPVEKFMDLVSAQFINLLFLLIVAVWRISLLFRFLSRSALLQEETLGIALLFPMAIIVVVLSSLNLEHAILDLMAGMRGGGSGTLAYLVVSFLSLISVVASPVLTIWYLFIAGTNLKDIYDERRLKNR